MFFLTFLLVFPFHLAVLSKAPVTISLLITSLVAAAVVIALLWQRLKACLAERDRLQTRLSQEIEQTQVMLHTIRDGVITTNAVGEIELLNPVAEEITGWQTQDAQGRSLSEVLRLRDSSTGQPLLHPLNAASDEPRSLSSLTCSALLQRRDQSERSVDSTRVDIQTSTGQVISSVVVLREAVPLHPSSPLTSWQDRYDALTGLVNRQEFEHCLQQAISLTQFSDQEHSLCLLDLDRFREINQVCGYVAGDELLRQVSRLLQNKVRKADTIARLGGDEFAVLLYQCPTEQATYVAQSLCEAIENLWFEWQGQNFSVGVSIGLVSLAANADPVAALKAADKACSIAKTQNRGGVHVYQMERAAPANSRSGTEQILQAIEDNRLRLYYQQLLPLQANLPEEKVYDLLPQILDSDGNLIAADAAVAAAEQYHLMTMIDRWVITTLFASELSSEFPGEFPNEFASQSTADRSQRACYSIKLAESSLTDPEFIAFLEEQFSTYRVVPHRICFEIPEAFVHKSLHPATQFLQSLKRMGCRIAIGSFGSSPAAWNHFQELPIDYLKISETLVQQLPTNPLALAIVEGIYLIAHRLGIKTIAASVSTSADQRQLAAIGIDYVQDNRIAALEPLSPLPQSVEPLL